MGKANSKNADTVKLQADIAQLQSKLSETQVKAQEAQNLLRYKVEVLVNMLATEEKRAEVTESRLSTLKMLVSSKGIDEKFLLSGNSNPTLQVDIDGAIQRMIEQFSLYRVDIIQAFADSEGKIITIISYDDFMKQIYTVTDENITTTDIQVISIRFGNGYGSVSVPDFLEYFTTPPQVRVAKASTSAVRMSLDLLQLEMEMDQTADVTNSIQDPSKDAWRGAETHRMDNLDGGARKLVLLWKSVRESIQNEISSLNIQSNFDGDGQIIPVTDFKIIMHTCCGDSSLSLRASSSAPSTQPLAHLNDSDIDLLVARFELRDTIHAGLFLQYFDELSRIQEYFSIKRGLGVSASVDRLSVSPFQVASEWKQLRARSVRAQTKAVTEKIIRKSLLSPIAEAPEPVPSSVPSPALVKETKGAAGSSSLHKDVNPVVNSTNEIKEEEKIEQPNSNSSKEVPEQKESHAKEPEQKNEEDSSGSDKQGNDIPLNKPSFMDFFRCGRAKKDDSTLQHNAPTDLPKAQPEEKIDSAAVKADVKDVDDSFVAEEKRGEGKMETPDEKRHYSPDEQALSIEVGGELQSQQPLQIKQDAKFSTPPKAMLVGGGKSNREKFDADSKKPSFSKPKDPVSAGATPGTGDNDGYSSQASDLSRRRQQPQQQQTTTTTEKKRNNSRFRKIPQKDFDVEDFADDSGSNGNDSFYRNKQQDLTPQENMMGRPFQRRPSGGSEGEEKDHRAVNFVPSTRGQ